MNISHHRGWRVNRGCTRRLEDGSKDVIQSDKYRKDERTTTYKVDGAGKGTFHCCMEQLLQIEGFPLKFAVQAAVGMRNLFTHYLDLSGNRLKVCANLVACE